MRLRILSFVAIVALGIWGYFWYEDFWDRHPVERINSESASGESAKVRELIFRAKSLKLDYRDESVAREWRLKVPSKFILGELGSNGALEPREFIVRLLYQVDPMTWEVRYKGGMEAERPGWIAVHAHIYNRTGLGARKFLKKEYCLDDEDKRNIFSIDTRGRYKEPRREVRDCSTPNCRLIVSYHGWNVEISLPIDVYLEKEKYCTHARQLLESWSTRTESLIP
jgi:hypothetical protein